MIPLTGEQFTYKSAVTGDDGRLDISARGVWTTMDKTLFDVRVYHPGAISNSGDQKSVCKRHEDEKKRKYVERVIEVEKATFTPLVYSTLGGCGEEAKRFHSRLAMLLCKKEVSLIARPSDISE